jgi:hypothetical protein
MGEVKYRSEVRVERVQGPVRLAYLPAESNPVTFSVHSAIAAHYGVPPEKFPAHAATIDYVIAAAAG